MGRWHESGCRQPEITFIDDIPCCNYCFALPPLDDNGFCVSPIITPTPRLKSQVQMNLTWPACVSYSRLKPSLTEDNESFRLSADATCEALVLQDTIHQSDSGEEHSRSTLFSKSISGDEIRLLQLSRGQPSSPIHCHISTIILGTSSLPSYEALSYTWADESRDVTSGYPVYIGPYWDIVHVTRNCSKGLRSIRHAQVDKLVWVDSLCINHGDVDEKTHQVGLMRKIYQNASAVIVYLGDASVDSTLALDSLKTAATPESWRSGNAMTIGQGSQIALRSLFQRPYFSRLWIIQEILHAQHLRFICGEYSVCFPNQLLPRNLLGPGPPSWLLDRGVWSALLGRNLLQLLLETSSYKCSDPRDKVFGVLGLLHNMDIYPNYGLSVESIYTGVAAYFLKNHHAFEVLALTGIGKKILNMPSWVPDWSQHMVERSPKAFFPSSEECEDIPDDVLDYAELFTFDTMLDVDPKLQIDIDTGVLQTNAVKLCDISGQITQKQDRTHISMSKGQQGVLIISLFDPVYAIETDSLFLLDGWQHPIVLRRVGMNSYLFISVCALSIRCPSSGVWLRPCVDPLEQADSEEIKILRFSHDEKELILAFYSRLLELSNVHSHPVSFQVARARVLDYGCLCLAGFRDIESRLRNSWNELNQSLGWMFRDPIAVRKLIHDINQGDQNRHSGEGEIHLDILESRNFVQYCGVEFSKVYTWDLNRFCSSFIYPSPSPFESTPLDNTWTPMFPQMKARLPEVRRWAEITEQLLNAFEYSQIILSKSWSVIPGANLLDKWARGYQGTDNVSESDLQHSDEIHPHELEANWNWSEFKATLALREQLWDEQLPNLLDPATSHSMAGHLGMRSLGLNLDSQETINIT